MARQPTSDMRDLEQELAESIGCRQSEGNPLEGLFNFTRRMDSEADDQFDVDMNILEFLAYKATDVVLEWRLNSDVHRSDLPDALVTMAAEWRNVLKHKYDGRRLNNQTAFRSRLLQFILLFTHRMNHEKTWTNERSLNEIRARNKSRGVYWGQQTSHSPALRESFDAQSQFPLADGALAQNRNELADKLGMPQDRRRWVTDVEGTPSLHCLLPLLIELTAARTTLEDDWMPTGAWQELAGQFMLQAVLEEYLRNGAFGDETFNTIFAFGCPGVVPMDDESDDISAMRRVFCDRESGHDQIPGWPKTRQQYINELLPQSTSVTSLEAMKAAQERYPYKDFEDLVIFYMQSLHVQMKKPDLVNVHGHELMHDDSRDIIRCIGIEP